MLSSQSHVNNQGSAVHNLMLQRRLLHCLKIRLATTGRICYFQLVSLIHQLTPGVDWTEAEGRFSALVCGVKRKQLKR